MYISHINLIIHHTSSSLHTRKDLCAWHKPADTYVHQIVVHQLARRVWGSTHYCMKTPLHLRQPHLIRTYQGLGSSATQLCLGPFLTIITLDPPVVIAYILQACVYASHIEMTRTYARTYRLVTQVTNCMHVYRGCSAKGKGLKVTVMDECNGHQTDVYTSLIQCRVV